MRLAILTLLALACSSATEGRGHDLGDDTGDDGSSSETTGASDPTETGTTGSPGISPDDWTAPGHCTIHGLTMRQVPTIADECPPCPPYLGWSACTKTGECGCSIQGMTDPTFDPAICPWGTVPFASLNEPPTCLVEGWPSSLSRGSPPASAYPVAGPEVCKGLEVNDGVRRLSCEAQRPGWVGWWACYDGPVPEPVEDWLGC